MPDFIESLRHRLVVLGCPMKQARRLVREVADHREDLKQAAISGGLSEADAEARANTSLGDPLVLAEQMMAVLRRSTWWGRHYVVGFCVVPLLAVPVLWLVLLLFQLSLEFTLRFGWIRRTSMLRPPTRSGFVISSSSSNALTVSRSRR